MDSTWIKGLNVLRVLVTAAEPMGVVALAAQMKLPRSNVHQTLYTLVEAGYAMRHDNGSYAATMRVWELGMY